MNEAPENVRLIGGEMLLWSDSSHTSGVTDWRGVALELVRRLLPIETDKAAWADDEAGAGEGTRCHERARAGEQAWDDGVARAGEWPWGGERARVLLVGPHPRGLVDEVVARASSVAVLLRSYPDACALAERHPGIAVHCGRLAALPAEETYDLVLALDGLRRTHSAEEVAPPWRESLGMLAARVAPGGRFVLSVSNDLGIDRFVEARPADRAGADEHWEPHGFDQGYPDGSGALDEELAAAGLVPERCYAAYPGRGAPRALLARELLGPDLPDALTVPLSARGGDRMLVADPLRLTRLVFRHGLGEQLAPVWVATATRPPIATTAPTATRPSVAPVVVGLPLGLVEEGHAVHEVTRSTTRQLPDGVERAIPGGRVVEEVLVEACAREDVRAVRDLLAALGGWVEMGGDAAADNLVWDGERFAAIHPMPVQPDRPADRVVLCRVLWRFAVRLLAAGHHHPWPWPRQAEQLALTLCGMAGRPCDQADLDLARKLDAELGQPAELSEAAPTYRDLLGARDRLADQLTAALARVSRLETKLTYRERELLRARGRLRKSQRKSAAYRRTLGYRLSRRLARPRKVARRVLRLLSG
ncbi:hypothetical protein [Nonomuraea sp. NEAU-A123]|uniref:hypothetical protein n=1 Tax=Nonomuraea sp. NEAU-A123 TaxID=2839649 RepID=UPI001BE40934|nr:hypothetical protein [Nonomuraea sp. NEAU-A123]MBT2224384.1 hypothetical protein [Nonomuraea sp. NEAU-A123]